MQECSGWVPGGLPAGNGSRRSRLVCHVVSFSLAQAFTPGWRRQSSSRSPLSGGLPRSALAKGGAMSHTFHQLYYHFVWGTHSREPLIDRGWRPQLLDIINDET